MCSSRLSLEISVHSFRNTVAYSAPRTFSARSWSSRPPNQISEPFGSFAYQSVFDS